MLKSDLVALLVNKRQLSADQAELAVDAVFDSMKEALCLGENIEVRGLGAFHVKLYPGYNGRNPKTGKVIPVKPKRGVRFRTGKDLRERVNAGGEVPAKPKKPRPDQVEKPEQPAPEREGTQEDEAPLFPGWRNTPR